MLPKFTTSKGFTIPYADHQDVIKMIKRIRQGDLFGYPFHYYFVTERGSKRGRPHVHGLIFIKKPENYDSTLTIKLEKVVRSTLFSQWKRNIGSDRKPIWKPLFQYRTKFFAGKRYSNFDCHYVTSHSSKDGEDDVSFYVTKYVLKPSKKEQDLQIALKLNYPIDEYTDTWKIVKSRSLCSKFFGAYTDTEKNYVRSCLERSKDDPDGFKYFDSHGGTQPISRYYRRFITPDMALSSVSARGGPITFDDRPIEKKISSVENSKRIRSDISNKDLSSILPD